MSERFEKFYKENSLKMTGQRKVIAKVVSEATDHPDVDEIYKRSIAINDKISMATVYRTLRMFEEAGVVEKHEFGDGRARYEEISDEHHYHLIDIKNDKIIEFQNEEIEKLQEKIARDLGYKIIDHRLELYCVPIEKK